MGGRPKRGETTLTDHHHDAEIIDLADVFLYDRIRRDMRAIEVAARTLITGHPPSVDALGRGTARALADLDDAVDQLLDRRRN